MCGAGCQFAVWHRNINGLRDGAIAQRATSGSSDTFSCNCDVISDNVCPRDESVMQNCGHSRCSNADKGVHNQIPRISEGQD